MEPAAGVRQASCLPSVLFLEVIEVTQSWAAHTLRCAFQTETNMTKNQLISDLAEEERSVLSTSSAGESHQNTDAPFVELFPVKQSG
jgi:hypothetical protein